MLFFSIVVCSVSENFVIFMPPNRVPGVCFRARGDPLHLGKTALSYSHPHQRPICRQEQYHPSLQKNHDNRNILVFTHFARSCQSHPLQAAAWEFRGSKSSLIARTRPGALPGFLISTSPPKTADNLSPEYCKSNCRRYIFYS